MGLFKNRIMKGMLRKLLEEKPSKEAQEIDYSKINNVLSKDVRIDGTIECKSNVIVHGEFKGDITTSGKIILSKTSKIKAELFADDIGIDGTADIKIQTDGNVVIGRTGKVSGIIKSKNIEIQGQYSGDAECENLIISNNGIFNGTINCEKCQIADNSSIDGHIILKSKPKIKKNEIQS